MFQLAKNTLLVIPCSGSKQPGNRDAMRTSILSTLDPNRASALANARAALRERAMVDERTLMPARQRYSGQLYEHGNSAIGTALSGGTPVVILSGGYGLLLADEPIGMYERRFSLSDWPRGLLEGCLVDYVRRESIQSVIALMSSTTDYGKLIRRVPWRSAGLHVTLLSPIAHGGGAMVKVPRAQGQALAAVVAGDINESWRSGDGLSVRMENLGA